MVGRFKKRPERISAARWDGTARAAKRLGMALNKTIDGWYLPTKAGPMYPKKGDWVIWGGDGGRHTCIDADFRDRYEAADGNARVLLRGGRVE